MDMKILLNKVIEIRANLLWFRECLEQQIISKHNLEKYHNNTLERVDEVLAMIVEQLTSNNKNFVNKLIFPDTNFYGNKIDKSTL